MRPHNILNDIHKDDLFLFTSNWIWRALDALATRSDFQANPDWIADRISVTVEEADDALQGLIRIGMLQQNSDGTFVSQQPLLYTNESNLPRGELFRIHEVFSKRLHEQLSLKDAFFNTMFVSNLDDINKFYNSLNDFVFEYQMTTLKNPLSKTVYAMDISIAKISKIET